MKKYLSLFLIILFSNFYSITTFSQSDSIFAPSNAQWWHNSYDVFVQESMVYARVSADTVIENLNCKKIEQTNYEKIVLPNGIHFSELPLAPIFVYSTLDTVWAYNQNFHNFTPLYVFNVQEGDTVCLPVFGADLRPNPIAGGDTCFCFVIDSIRTVLYDTIYLQTFFEHSLASVDSQNPNSWYQSDWPVYNWAPSLTGNSVPTGAYTRKTGGLLGGLLPTSNMPGVAKPTSDSMTYSGYGLRCYTDDAIAIHLAQLHGEQCLFDTTTAIADVPSLNALVSFYPNPIQHSFQLKSTIPLPFNTELWLTDISGRVIEKLESPSGKMIANYQLKEYVPGIYLFVLSANGTRIVKKIILTN